MARPRLNTRLILQQIYSQQPVEIFGKLLAPLTFNRRFFSLPNAAPKRRHYPMNLAKLATPWVAPAIMPDFSAKPSNRRDYAIRCGYDEDIPAEEGRDG